MATQTITFKNGTTLPVIAVYSNKDLIQGAYRECFEIRFPTEAVTYDTLTALAVSENLKEITLTETESDVTNRVSKYFNFTIVTGMGMKTAPEDGTPYCFLSVAQKSDAELAIEQLKQDNEDVQAALVELAGIVAGE